MKNYKKSIFEFFRSKVFRKYLISYFGIVLILLSILGILMMRHISGRMQQEEIRITESKLGIIVDDIENQVETMRRIVVEVASLQEFRMDFWSADKYREMQLLECLDDYRYEVGIAGEYFVKYAGKDMVFKSTADIALADVHLSGLFGAADHGELLQKLEEIGKNPADEVTFYKQGSTMLFLYPLKEYAYSQIGLDAVLCFVVTEKNLRDRFDKLVGNMEGQYRLYHKEWCLLDDIVTENEETLKTEVVVGDSKLTFHLDRTEVFSWENVFSAREQWLLFLALLAIILVGFVLAYFNYLPMRKLVDKYKKVTNVGLVADWKSIEVMIESLLQSNEKSDDLLKKQYQMLKEQTIRSIALGGYSNRIQKYLTLLNIELSGNIWGIIRCDFGDEDAALMYDRVYGEIEALSENDLLLYMYWDNEPRILFAVEEEYQIDEVRDLLQELFGVLNVSGNTELISISNSLSEIHQGKTKAKAFLKEQKQNVEESVVAKAKQNAVAVKAVDYIKANFLDYDLTLEMLADKFQVTATYMGRIIKQEIGTSYKEFLIMIRMEAAKKMLLEQEDMNVADVCQSVGYNHVSHFIKVFQKHTGMTPAKFREEHCQSK